jgi:hypothetical protein
MRWGLGLFTLGAFMVLMVITFAHLIATYHGLEYGCLVDGPRSTLAIISEAPGIVEGRFSYWPLGRECEWVRADGNGTVVARPESWTGTLALVASASIALSGIVLIGLATFRRR